MASLPVITFDYGFSPYAQKIRHALAANAVSFLRNDVPPLIPRPTLEKLGVSFRRIPVLAIGKDMYADTSLIIDVLQKKYNVVPTNAADKAFEAFGNSVFSSALSVIPAASLTEEFRKDRVTIFPFLNRPDYASLRPSGLAEVRSQLQIIENDLLGASSGVFIAGSQLSLADVHIAWVVKWLLETIAVGKEPGFGQENFPLIHKWIESLPEQQFKDITAEETINLILNSGYSATDTIGVDSKDYLEFKEGTLVNVESADADPGAHPQLGKLVGLNDKEVVIELDTGIRLHFPRKGYIVRQA